MKYFKYLMEFIDEFQLKMAVWLITVSIAVILISVVKYW